MSFLHGLRPKIALAAIIACLLSIGISDKPAASAFITGGPPCCTAPIDFASDVMRDYLEEVAHEPGLVQVAWLRDRLEGQDYDSVLALRAVMAGHCLQGCSLEIAIATETIKDIVEERYREREARAQWVIIGVSSLVALLAGGLGAILSFWLARRYPPRQQQLSHPLGPRRPRPRRPSAPVR